MMQSLFHQNDALLLYSLLQMTHSNPIKIKNEKHELIDVNLNVF